MILQNMLYWLLFICNKYSMKDFISNIPKAELHLHIEGTFEPELMLAIAQRNKIELKYKSVDELKQAYNFNNLQDFLDIYYQGAGVPAASYGAPNSVQVPPDSASVIVVRSVPYVAIFIYNHIDK